MGIFVANSVKERMNRQLAWIVPMIFSLQAGMGQTLVSRPSETKILILKNKSFAGNDLEALYTSTCSLTKNAEPRYFNVIKTGKELKSFFLSDFILIERTSGTNTKYYPIGWETATIQEKEVRASCLSILKGKIAPVEIEN